MTLIDSHWPNTFNGQQCFVFPMSFSAENQTWKPWLRTENEEISDSVGCARNGFLTSRTITLRIVTKIVYLMCNKISAICFNFYTNMTILSPLTTIGRLPQLPWSTLQHLSQLVKNKLKAHYNLYSACFRKFNAK